MGPFNASTDNSHLPKIPLVPEFLKISLGKIGSNVKQFGPIFTECHPKLMIRFCFDMCYYKAHEFYLDGCLSGGE